MLKEVLLMTYIIRKGGSIASTRYRPLSLRFVLESSYRPIAPPFLPGYLMSPLQHNTPRTEYYL
jgi:hypothetical protein